jgi:hypothetical protein
MLSTATNCRVKSDANVKRAPMFLAEADGERFIFSYVIHSLNDHISIRLNSELNNGTIIVRKCVMEVSPRSDYVLSSALLVIQWYCVYRRL